jgi:Flp pilus assembly protein TadD
MIRRDFPWKSTLGLAAASRLEFASARPANEESAGKPSLGCARYELGRAWFRQSQYEKAEGHLLAATALNPSYAPAYVLLGQCYVKLGKSEKAQAAFQKSQALDQEHLEHIQQDLSSTDASTDQRTPQ